MKYNVWLRVSGLNFKSTFYLHIKILFQDLDFPMTSLELDFEWNWDRRYLSYFTNDDWRMIFLFAEKIFWTPKFAIIMAIQKSHFCVWKSIYHFMFCFRLKCCSLCQKKQFCMTTFFHTSLHTILLGWTDIINMWIYKKSILRWDFLSNLISST